MRNPTSRHLQTPKPLSTFQSDLCEARHDGCALRHALLSPLTLQIISAIMVARSAVGVSPAQLPVPRHSILALIGALEDKMYVCEGGFLE